MTLTPAIEIVFMSYEFCCPISDFCSAGVAALVRLAACKPPPLVLPSEEGDSGVGGGPAHLRSEGYNCYI